MEFKLGQSITRGKAPNIPYWLVTPEKYSSLHKRHYLGVRRGGSGAVTTAMSGRWRWCICAAAAVWRWWRRGIGSGTGATIDADPLLGLHCSAWLQLLGLLCSACIRVTGLCCVLAAQGKCGGGKAALALLGLLLPACYAWLAMLGLLCLA